MKLIVGLGNPGEKYLFTRHNVGFILCDLIVSQKGLSWSQNRFKGHFCTAEISGHQVGFLKPMTFMNLSGKSLVEAMAFFKVAPKDLLVVHDDIDLPPGVVRFKAGGGHGGHNGIRSIVEYLKTPDFSRIKIGVGRPEIGGDVAGWVLSEMSESELDTVRLKIRQEVEDHLIKWLE